jgi:hypothetical protein
MSKESIWVRQRRLKKEEEVLLSRIRQTFRGLAVELDNDDWQAATTSSDLLVTQCIRQNEIELELDDVDWIVGKFDQIGERMEKLESEARQHGWKAHD